MGQACSLAGRTVRMTRRALCFAGRAQTLRAPSKTHEAGSSVPRHAERDGRPLKHWTLVADASGLASETMSLNAPGTAPDAQSRAPCMPSTSTRHTARGAWHAAQNGPHHPSRSQMALTVVAWFIV